MTTTDEHGTTAVVIPLVGTRQRFLYPATGGCFRLSLRGRVVEMVHGTAEIRFPPNPVEAHEEARAMHAAPDYCGVC